MLPNGTRGANASGTPGAGGSGGRTGAGAFAGASGAAALFTGQQAAITDVKPGMTANVTLITNVTFGLAVPSRFITSVTVQDDTGRPRQVKVLDILKNPQDAKSGTDRKEISTGYTGDTLTEITGGVEQGDTLLYTAPAGTRSTTTSQFPGAPAGGGGNTRTGGNTTGR